MVLYKFKCVVYINSSPCEQCDQKIEDCCNANKFHVNTARKSVANKEHVATISTNDNALINPTLDYWAFVQNTGTSSKIQNVSVGVFSTEDPRSKKVLWEQCGEDLPDKHSRRSSSQPTEKETHV